MKLGMVLLTILFLGVVTTPAPSFAQSRAKVYSALQIKQRLIQAKYNLQRLDAEIAERSSDHSVMNEIMPHDEYVGGSFFENDIEENKQFLKKLRVKRIQMVNAMAYYESKYGFGPEIYRNRAVATNPYDSNLGRNN